jgi:hypothetical protein
MNKKIIILSTTIAFIIWITIVLSYTINAEEAECKIKNPPKYMTEYMKNIKKMYNNAKSWWKWDGECDTPFNKNHVFNWTWYEVDSEFNTEEETQEIPKQVKRDTKKLKKTYKELEFVWKKWWCKTIAYKDFCKWIDEEFCKKYSKSEHLYVDKVILDLKKSTIAVANLIKNQATKAEIQDEK